MGSILVLGGVGFTVKEVVETARKVTEHPIPAKEEPRRAGDPSMLIASSAKAREVLGFHNMQIWKQLSVRHGNGIKVIQMDIRMCEGGECHD